MHFCFSDIVKTLKLVQYISVGEENEGHTVLVVII